MFRTKVERERTHLEKRVSSIPTPDLVNWAEQCLNSLGRDLSRWQRSGDEVFVQEAETAAEALLTVIRQIRSRTAS